MAKLGVLAAHRRALRRISLAVGQAMIERAPWPPADVPPEAGIAVRFGRTPKNGFKICSLTPADGSKRWRVKLLESNPAKVKDAANKVMVYLEIPEGNPVQTGQVRRQHDQYSLRWFPPEVSPLLASSAERR